MLHSVASMLGLHCFHMSHKKGARLIWVKHVSVIIKTTLNNNGFLVKKFGNVFLRNRFETIFIDKMTQITDLTFFKGTLGLDGSDVSYT